MDSVFIWGQPIEPCTLFFINMETEELRIEELIKIPATVAHLLKKKISGHWI